METIDIDVRILNVIKEQQYVIHHSNEKDYADLGENGVCIEILNRSRGNSIFIDRDDEFTLSFGYMHSHFSTSDETEIGELVQLIDGILSNRICAVSIGQRHKDKQFEWLGSTFSPSEAAQNGNIETLFPEIYSGSHKRRKCNVIVLQYWDDSLNKEIPMLQRHRLLWPTHCLLFQRVLRKIWRGRF